MLAVRAGHVEVARVLVDAGASVDVIPRGQDGNPLTPSLIRLAAGSKRGDLVALMASALFKRDSADRWLRNWSSGVGISWDECVD